MEERALTDVVHIWEMRNPDGGSTGLEFARGRMEAHDLVLGHSLPERVDVVVTDESGNVVARGEGLQHETIAPMSRLAIGDGQVERENAWLDQSDVGKPVILPGGEVGILQSWWHADDHRAWKWVVEFSNHVDRAPDA